jgi:hypothetical protein
MNGQDKELTRLACLACGGAVRDGFDPLTDDGDALRLAAVLNIGIEMGLCYCEATTVDMVRSSTHRFMEDWGAGPTMLEVRMRRIRRAIVRAAAEIGATK